MRILLLDDSLCVHSFFKVCFAGHKDIEIVSAERIAKAMALVRINDFDLIISDINLPDGKASDFVSYVRSTKDIPIVVVSGTANRDEILACLRAGARKFVRKPFGAVDILKALDEIKR